MTDKTTGLDPIRSSITALDGRLLGLLAERRALSLKVAEQKIQDQRKVRDTAREQALLVKLIQQGRELGLDAHYVTQLYHTIIEDSVLSQQAYLQSSANAELEAPLNRVAFLGAPGSYSFLATQKYFSKRPGELMEIGCQSFAEVVSQVESGTADYAVLPIENTTSGSINEVYDQLQHASVHIVGEITHPIKHSLLACDAVEPKQIKTLYAHPQVYAQCSHFLASMSDVRVEYCDSTSSALARVSELQDPTSAAIGSVAGGELYGLTLLQSDLANQKENHSRFIVVARKPVDVPEQVPAKTTLVMAVGQKAGSLVEALIVLRDHGIIMTKLESRPMPGNPWEELFYIDLEGNVNEPNMQQAIRELGQLTRVLKVLGCYPSEMVLPTQVPAADFTPQSKGAAIEEKPAPILSPNKHPLVLANTPLDDAHFVIIAGPDQGMTAEKTAEHARVIKDQACHGLMLNCYHHRDFNTPSLDESALQQATKLGQQYQLPVMAEIHHPDHIQTLAKALDLLVVGPRNMQNLPLLHAVGRSHKPVILHRGHMSSVEDVITAAEHIVSQGNQQLILCEPGIRTFETHARNTLDISAIAQLKAATNLPVMVAPSHAVDDAQHVQALTLAARAAGANGVILDVNLGHAQQDTSAHPLSLHQLQQLTQHLHQR